MGVLWRNAGRSSFIVLQEYNCEVLMGGGLQFKSLKTYPLCPFSVVQKVPTCCFFGPYIQQFLKEPWYVIVISL